MLTLITGTPGSGKTLYTVSSIIPEYAAQTTQEQGGEAKPRRILVDGIKDLIIEHEMLSPTTYNALQDKNECTGEGVLNWWEWCKPGDVIVIDEVQRIWRPRGNGSKVPQMIAELETHRHRGVDFVLITQHPMLLDQNVRRLVSRHIHIRRMWGGARAVRYEWDHCSAPDRVSDAGKSYWPYPKDAFKYYKSAEVHTKQGGKVPMALLILALAIIALPFVAYFALNRVHGLLNGETAEIAAKAQPKEVKLAEPKPLAPEAPDRPQPAAMAAVVPESPVSSPAPVARHVGCIASATRCRCFDQTGHEVERDDKLCPDVSQKPATPLPGYIAEYRSLGRTLAARDEDRRTGELIAFLKDNRGPVERE